jgi:autotransporter-associated beta strand protein
VAAGRIPGDVTINGSTAALDLGNNQNGNVATVTLDGGGSITGAGTSTLTSRTSFQMNSGSVTAIMAGVGIPLVKSTPGTVFLSAANTYTGATTINGGVLVVNGSILGTATVNSTGTLGGNGSVGGLVTVASGGILSPGNSPGVLIVGSLTLQSGSQTKVELGGTARGTQFDAVLSGGSVNLGGTLAVSLVSGFLPKAGDAFDILDWGSRSGTFDAMQLPTMNGRIVWDSSQLYNTGSLSVLSTYYAGDINRDGNVNVADISSLMTALSDLYGYQAAQQLTDPQLLADVADVNGDGHVNNLDLQALLNLVANGSGSSGGSGSGALASVPEPASLILLMLALTAFVPLYWWRRLHIESNCPAVD